MKKIILSALAICAFGFANAQDKKEMSEGGMGFNNGDIFITGSVGFNSSKTGDAKSNGFDVSPSIGFFVSDNIAVGGRVGYNSTTTNSGAPGADDAKSSTFSIGGFGRYYATPASQFSMFVELGLNYHSTTENAGDGFDDVKSTGFGIALAPGISYFVSDNWALEASIAALSYNTDKPDFDGAESTNNFGLNVDLSNVSVGVIYKF
ncbi:MAG: porin family protein [Flavobacterium sp.]|nr:MAG: porin family protein [Flavobacterium sp.]